MVMYVIGEHRKYSDFLFQVIKGLSASNASRLNEGIQMCGSFEIETKYYKTEIEIIFLTAYDFVGNKEKSECLKLQSQRDMKAILLLLDEDSLEDQPLLNDLFFTLSEKNKSQDVTRLLCLIEKGHSGSLLKVDNRKNDYEKHFSKRTTELRNKCISLNYELIPVSMAHIPQIHQDYCYNFSNDHLLFSYNDGIQRVIQALHCTSWKATTLKDSVMPENENYHPNTPGHSEITFREDSLLDNFQILSDLIRELKSDAKSLTDDERRERASKLVLDITKYINQDPLH